MTCNKSPLCLLTFVIIGCIVGGVLAGGCQNREAQAQAPPPPVYFSTNQKWVEGLHAEGVDLRSVDEVFGIVFSQLPDEVIIYPSENYYYYTLVTNGRLMWGNIRLAAGYREQGIISFAYFEFDEFGNNPRNMFTRSKLYSKDEGVEVTEIDRFTYTVNYKKKKVTFHLHRLPQVPPKLFSLGDDEIFIERTFDESGYQFFLLFNKKDNYFFWVLNEEETVPDVFDPIGETGDIIVGRRSGFAFWVDAKHEERKILASIRQHSVNRNDYYDGPFDQLADNYADEVHISEYMQTAFPALKGRIDKYGYYTDTDRPLRVAITAYTTYYTYSQVQQFMERAKESGDPISYISRRGVPQPDSTTQTTGEKEK